MSGQPPINAQSRELDVLRVLFDRGLLDRAVSLAESRWPGSGEMVRLAYDWSQLAPAERRERLSAIGPEDVARMRELATLNPEFAAVVQNLDERGVLPHVEQMAASGVAAASAASAPSASPAPAAGAESTGVPEPNPPPTAAEPAEAPTPVVEADVQAQIDAVNAAAQRRIDELRREAAEIERMDAAQLAAESARRQGDAQPVAQFLSAEEARRRQSFADAEAAMQRVHQRLDRVSNKLLGAADVKIPALPALDTALPPLVAGAAAAQSARATQVGAPTNIVAAPERLAREFAGQVVVSLADEATFPTGDELIALANDLGLALREFTITPGATRAVFGALTRNGQRVEPVAGPLPSALARATLAVVRGKLYPDLIARMEAGYADIPGTRATVRMHPKSRVLVLAG